MEEEMKIYLYKVLLLLSFVVTLVACGGGSDQDVSSTSIYGTVASGDGLVSTVKIVDRRGDVFETTSSSDGKFSIELQGSSGPYLIKATADEEELVLYSYSATFGVANVTELTTLALLLVKNVDLDDEFENWNLRANRWKRSDVERGIATVNANFSDDFEREGLDAKKYDFFVEEFETDKKGIDAVLDSYEIQINAAARDYEIRDSSESVVEFDENIDTSDFRIGAVFDVEADSQWSYTFSMEINGQGGQPVTFPFTLPGEDVPYNEPRFLEDGFSRLDDDNYNYESDDGSFKFEVLEYSTSYSSSGDGDVGSKIKGSVRYKYRYEFEYLGEKTTEEFEWFFEITYERVS